MKLAAQTIGIVKRILNPLLIGITLIIAEPTCAANNPPLTLIEAEHIALANAPELNSIRANTHALEQQAIAEGQLADPQLVFGPVNVPTNNFSFTQDEMTMIEGGIQQNFPKGHSLAIKSHKAKILAEAEKKRLQDQSLLLLRYVRESWLNNYYWMQALRILKENQTLLTYLLDTTKSQLSNGKANQTDLIQVQLELSRLENQVNKNEEEIELSQNQLARWLGTDQAKRPLAATLPQWSMPPSLEVLKSHLQRHPTLKVDSANIAASKDEIAFAKEQFKPGWMLDVDYGVRQGRMIDGSKRANMLTAQITLDLPIFPGQRQDRRLRESIYRFEISEFNRQTHFRDLSKELMDQYTTWEHLSQQLQIFNQKIIPAAKRNTKSALSAFQYSNADFTTVLRAYTTLFDAQLEALQIQVASAKARAALLYLEGVTQ